MAACGIKVLQNSICVALPVLTYLVSFVSFHCSSQQCYLQETYRELNWQSQVYFTFEKKNKTVVDQIVLEKLKKKIQQQQNYCGSFLEKTITVNRSKTKNMSLLILPKYMSS